MPTRPTNRKAVSIIGKVQRETAQWHDQRVGIIKAIESHFKKRVVIFQTSFQFDNGFISDEDATMLEEVLFSSNIRSGLLSCSP
jgi:hypothetical protein